MLFEEDYLDISGDLLSEMRLLVEGAITPYEDDTGCLNRLATEVGQEDARSALNDIGSALYLMRRHIKRLQAEHRKASIFSSPIYITPLSDIDISSIIIVSITTIVKLRTIKYNIGSKNVLGV